MTFTISDYKIENIRKKRLLIVSITGILSVIIWGTLSFYAMKDINFKIFAISFFSSIIIISVILYFSLKHFLKKLVEKLKNIQYTIENERIFIKQDFEQFNFAKEEIQCINKYKNNEIFIFLNTNKKIIINKYLDNYDQLIDTLNSLSKINGINKNPNIDLENMNSTRLIANSLFFVVIIMFILMNKLFGITIPKTDDNDPMIFVTFFLPIIVLLIILWFISSRINKRIKNKKYIIIFFYATEIIFISLLMSNFYLQSLKGGLAMTLVFFIVMLIQSFFIYVDIITPKKEIKYRKKQNGT